MTREQIYEALRKTLSEELEIDAEKINMDASFKDDLEADSLHLIELSMELEDSYGIKIPDEEALELTTVGSVVDYLSARLATA
ncbi:MAG TPA: acyl carrier protein [Solirubrobacterales bacterium]|jgi:acyl carrier protein|nr:acyl carrier protein [Solirubrobacterales bacterium]